MALEYTPGSIVSDGHVVLTGPISGTVKLADGTVVDVSPVAIEVSSQEEADEIADLVAKRYVDEGHPELVVVDDETGEEVQLDFVYVTPDELAAQQAETEDES